MRIVVPADREPSCRPMSPGARKPTMPPVADTREFDMSRLLYRLGHGAAAHPWRVLAAWALAAVAVVVGAATFGADLDDSFGAPGLDSTRAGELLEAAADPNAGLTAQVLAAPTATSATLSDVAADVDRLERDLSAQPDVVAVARTDAPDGRIALLTVQYPVLEEVSVAHLDRLHEVVSAAVSDDLVVAARGDLHFAFAEAETGTAEMIGLVVALVVLLVAFGSLLAAGLPIGVALFGLLVGVSSMSLVAHVVAVPSWVPSIAAMIGLGAGIDYALFLLTRHREFLDRGVPVPDAVGRAVATAGGAVLFAGGTVMVAILGLAVAAIPFITAAGVAIALVVLVMVIASLTLLPAFLGLAGHRVRGRRTADRSTSPIGWQRWSRHVARHATAYTVGVVVLLVGLAAPVTAMRLGFPDDGNLPVGTSQRTAYDLVADGFGPGTNGPLVVAVDTAGDASWLAALTEAVTADPGVAVATLLPGDADVRTIVAVPTTAPQDEATVDTIARLRSAIATLSVDHPGRAHVGGVTATFADLGQRVQERLPVLVGAVILLSFLLLVVVFRSALVPLKAAVLNLLSIGAAYGVIVAVFQWGWGADLLGVEGTIPIVSFIPMFLFAILFGLSMDYEVFLLSRVREEWVRTGDNHTAVTTGLASTARVITSAALIMVSVFLGFVLSPDPTTKMFGLGLATAIAVDATVVRMVLVPATMTLLGDRNWWLPAWLDRLLPHVDLDRDDLPTGASVPPTSAVELDRLPVAP